ncbi:MAG: T9SS type A sorting domain-containing protein [Chitinophagales bacterium]
MDIIKLFKATSFLIILSFLLCVEATSQTPQSIKNSISLETLLQNELLETKRNHAINMNWNIAEKTTSWYPLEDINGDLITNYAVVITQNDGSIISYNVTLEDATIDSDGNIMFVIGEIDCEGAACVYISTIRDGDTDFLTIVAALNPPTGIIQEGNDFDVFARIAFLVSDGTTYGPCSDNQALPLSYQCCNTAEECFELIATNHDILVNKIDLEVFGITQTVCNFSNTPASYVKNNWSLEEENIASDYQLNGNTQAYEYSKLVVENNASTDSTSTNDISFNYRVQVSYSHFDAPNTTLSYPSNNSVSSCNANSLTYISDGSAKNFSTEETPLLSKVFPNPCQNYMNIAYTLANDSEISIHIYDILGKQVSTISSNEYQMAGKQHIAIDMSHLPNGIYVCRMSQSNGEVANQRFIKIE